MRRPGSVIPLIQSNRQLLTGSAKISACRKPEYLDLSNFTILMRQPNDLERQNEIASGGGVQSELRGQNFKPEARAISTSRCCPFLLQYKLR